MAPELLTLCNASDCCHNGGWSAYNDLQLLCRNIPPFPRRRSKHDSVIRALVEAFCDRVASDARFATIFAADVRQHLMEQMLVPAEPADYGQRDEQAFANSLDRYLTK